MSLARAYRLSQLVTPAASTQMQYRNMAFVNFFNYKRNAARELASKNFNDFVRTLNFTPEEKEEMLFVDVPEPYSAREHFFNIKKYRALRNAGFQPWQVRQAREDYNVSIGQMSLEWCLPSPPPVHTWEEPPIIKEAPDYE